MPSGRTGFRTVLLEEEGSSRRVTFPISLYREYGLEVVRDYGRKLFDRSEHEYAASLLVRGSEIVEELFDIDLLEEHLEELPNNERVVTFRFVKIATMPTTPAPIEVNDRLSGHASEPRPSNAHVLPSSTSQAMTASYACSEHPRSNNEPIQRHPMTVSYGGTMRPSFSNPARGILQTISPLERQQTSQAQVNGLVAGGKIIHQISDDYPEHSERSVRGTHIPLANGSALPFNQKRADQVRSIHSIPVGLFLNGPNPSTGSDSARAGDVLHSIARKDPTTSPDGTRAWETPQGPRLANLRVETRKEPRGEVAPTEGAYELPGASLTNIASTNPDPSAQPPWPPIARMGHSRHISPNSTPLSQSKPRFAPPRPVSKTTFPVVDEKLTATSRLERQPIHAVAGPLLTDRWPRSIPPDDPMRRGALPVTFTEEPERRSSDMIQASPVSSVPTTRNEAATTHAQASQEFGGLSSRERFVMVNLVCNEGPPQVKRRFFPESFTLQGDLSAEKLDNAVEDFLRNIEEAVDLQTTHTFEFTYEVSLQHRSPGTGIWEEISLASIDSAQLQIVSPQLHVKVQISVKPSSVQLNNEASGYRLIEGKPRKKRKTELFSGVRLPDGLVVKKTPSSQFVIGQDRRNRFRMNAVTVSKWNGRNRIKLNVENFDVNGQPTSLPYGSKISLDDIEPFDEWQPYITSSTTLSQRVSHVLASLARASGPTQDPERHRVQEIGNLGEEQAANSAHGLTTPIELSYTRMPPSPTCSNEAASTDEETDVVRPDKTNYCAPAN